MAKIKFDLEKEMLDYIQKHPNSSSREIYEGLRNIVAFATVKRTINILLEKNLVASTGRGKSTKYAVSKAFDILAPIEIETYFEKEIDEREIKETFNFDLIKETLKSVLIFTKDEIEKLSNLQNQFSANISKLSVTEFNKEFERLAIDLSWKSS